jgi:biopolymer transport protein TolR
MGMSAGGSRGGLQAAINVTPLIDVLLVLLIIFLVVMPIMMKKETLEVPPKISDRNYTDVVPFTVTVKVTGDLVFNDGEKDQPISAADLARTLRPRLEAMHLGTEKVVFVDFEDAVPWSGVIGTMDQIRSLAEDIDHDGIKVALKVKDQVPTGAQ